MMDNDFIEKIKQVKEMKTTFVKDSVQKVTKEG